MKKMKLLSVFIIASMAVSFIGCKSNTTEPLPPIGGYNSADEVAKADLVAYWPLNGNGIESLSTAAPATTKNVTWMDGVKGQAASFNVGFLAYNTIANLGTNLQSGFTISAWVKLTNNGSTGSVIFSLSRPNEWAGNINFMSETGWMPATSDSLTVKGLLVSSTDLGWQDTRNTVKANAADLAAGHIAYPNKIGGKWAHAVYTWDNTTRLAKIYVNGVKISNPVWESRGAAGQTFAITTPTHPIIGAFETFANGTTTDSWNTGLVGQLDEIRVWKRALILSDIGALYELEKAGR
ncbi:MAG: LamG domain-containing protein [Paludibacter sp.]|nr:LamG domain-containing protein [Paludibacter sp.]